MLPRNMCRGFCVSLVTAILATGLSACLSAGGRVDLPLAPRDCSQNIPSGYEMQAILQVTAEKQAYEYFLALGTAGNRVDLAVLTPQGVPVYTVRCSELGPEVTLQTRSQIAIAPLSLMAYLNLVYQDGSVLSQRLQTGWVLEQSGGERVFWRLNEDRGIRIRYKGAPPWFSSIVLEDRLNDMKLALSNLEDAPVLPE